MRYFACGVIFVIAFMTALSCSAQDPAVDFSYAFATPHRMTVAPPESGDKTLLDCEPGNLRLGWTYENLTTYPLAAFMTPQAVWGVRITPQIDGKPLAKSAWTRAEGFLPVLDNSYTDPEGSVRLEVTGAVPAALVRVTLSNTGAAKHTFRLVCESQRGFFGYNPGYVDADKDKDVLLAGWGERADRVIVFGTGAQTYAVSNATTLCPTWELAPGEEKVAWIVRPYRANAADLPALRAKDWQAEADQAKADWRALLGRASRLILPDEGVKNAFYACLGDFFIMREPVAAGFIMGTPGTDGYRAPNAGEAAIAAVVLDQLGLHKEAEYGFIGCLGIQGDDGDWNDPTGWGHLMWAMSGFKSWTVMEHYRNTGDRAWLESVYPRMLASSRWQEKQRARTRVMAADGGRPLTYGLMPRGMGDCGLKDGDDLYGVFLPHNMWATYADRCAMETALILGRTEEAVELKKIYETANADLMQTLTAGCIKEDGYAWIPGVAGKTCGSRWGALNALQPCGTLPADHELVTGTIKQLRAHMSPGGLPINTGWLPKGLWVAIALDNLAEAHLARNEGDEAAALFYATLNHATPLVTWCEERAPEPGAKECTGDRQHLWTPVAVVRELRDSLVMEDGNELHLGRGVPRHWFATNKPIGIQNASTHFGDVSWEMVYDPAKQMLQGKVTLPKETPVNQTSATALMLHTRLPNGLRLLSVNPTAGATLLPDGSGLRWESPKGELTFIAAAG